MTNERREELIAIALVLSIVVHVGLMLFVRPHVMTTIVSPEVRSKHHEPMRITRGETRPEPVRIDSVTDLAAPRDAPAVTDAAAAPMPAAPSAEASVTAEAPEPVTPVAIKPVVAAPAVFDAKPVGLNPVARPIVRLSPLQTPSGASARASEPTFSVAMSVSVAPPVPDVPPPGRDPSSVFLPAKLTRGSSTASAEGDASAAPHVTFTPAEQVYAKVDEKIVAAEKTAVRELVENENASDLARFVNVTMQAEAAKDGWRYFRVMLVPRRDLKVVPKDVVMLIDGSGSIGNDRFGRCRRAARQILRTATNTGDRFNLVVFRNDFSYAFQNWRPCDAESFAVGDKWLLRQTAHGRTDVFSTIRSVLTLPRDPKRPLIALVVTDGDANAGVSDTAEILSRFTALNEGLVSVYMYGVKANANRELIDVLTHGNRGESLIHSGWRWNAGEGMETLSERFRDPVLSDLHVVFASETQAETYPRLLRNVYRGGTLTFVGRVPASNVEVAFSLKGLNGETAYEGFFKLPVATAPADDTIAEEWASERTIDRKLFAK